MIRLVVFLALIAVGLSVDFEADEAAASEDVLRFSGINLEPTGCFCEANQCQCCADIMIPGEEESERLCQTFDFDALTDSLSIEGSFGGESMGDAHIVGPIHDVGTKHHGKSFGPFCTTKPKKLPPGFKACVTIDGVNFVGNFTLQICAKLKVAAFHVTLFRKDFGCLWIRREQRGSMDMQTACRLEDEGTGAACLDRCLAANCEEYLWTDEVRPSYDLPYGKTGQCLFQGECCLGCGTGGYMSNIESNIQ